jgi:hypothetical protein
VEHLGLSAYNFPLMSDVNSPQFWQQSYQDGRFPWDLGGPTPVFQRLLEHKRFPPGRMIVLGAGRGHDARLFARYGFNVLEELHGDHEEDAKIHVILCLHGDFLERTGS